VGRAASTTREAFDRDSRGFYNLERNMRAKSLAIVLVLTAAGWTAATLFAHDEKETMEVAIHRSDEIVWQDGPPSLPAGSKSVVLEGDPSKPGQFVFRVKFPDGYRIPPHTHPKPERVTIIAGTLHLGMGGTFDVTKGETLPVGTYGTWSAHMKHYVWSEGETIVQIHGDGPWGITYVNPADDPRNAKK
jgi:quercetin dioxygenase-like cupin family protein